MIQKKMDKNIPFKNFAGIRIFNCRMQDIFVMHFRQKTKQELRFISLWKDYMMWLLHIARNLAQLYSPTLYYHDLKHPTAIFNLKIIILNLLVLVVLFVLAAWYCLTLLFANHKVSADLYVHGYMV